MRILYLSYNQPDSFDAFCRSGKINCPWVDSLLEEIVKCESLNIALAVPVNSFSFQKYQNGRITLFGLPNPKAKNFFRKIYQRITQKQENSTVNSYASQAISDFMPDIIQIFGSENPLGLILNKHRIPGIMHIQGYLQVVQEKWFKGISKWEQYRYANIKDLLLRQGSYYEYCDFRKKAEREAVILKNCRHFIGRTNFDKQLLSLFSPGSSYFHCEEFIRQIFFDNKWNASLNNEVTCISILKGTSYKGIDVLVETLLILKKHPVSTFKFKICGVSQDEEIVKIIKRKYKNEISNLNIEFLGKLNAVEMVEQLCSSNFYIHPSYIENSPNSVCEAMALGMPVISTNVGGISSLITDRSDGLLVQEGEPYSMSAAIINLINNYEYAKLLGENARNRAIKRHNPETIVKCLLDIYKTILFKNDQR
jgi:glycosyltransferase involved in cell wall biosynthesis